MRRGKASLTVKAEGGIVSIVASSDGVRSSTLNIPPKIASELAEQLIDASVAAQAQFIDQDLDAANSDHSS